MKYRILRPNEKLREGDILVSLGDYGTFHKQSATTMQIRLLAGKLVDAEVNRAGWDFAVRPETPRELRP